MINRGPLVIVELSPGRFARMYESDALRQNLTYIKERRPVRNKMITPTTQKVEKTEAELFVEEVQKITDEAEEAPDDFSEIQGVGPSTSEELYSHGIMTFDDLAGLDLGEVDWLNSRAISAIEDWQETL